MKFIRTGILLASIGLLSACGGGSSSSGDGDSSGSAGVYSGDHEVLLTGSGISETAVIFLTMTVNADDTFSIVDGEGGADTLTVTGTLDGSNFSASGNLSFTDSGVTCSIDITYSGTVSASSADGNDNGSGVCSANGQSININLSGQFSLPRTSNARSPRGGSFMHHLRNAL